MLAVIFGVLAGLFFGIAVVGWACAVYGKEMHEVEMASYKKVGSWYENRVTELEDETRSLAGQLVATGAVVHHAMPISPIEHREYAYDDTGLVRETLDPRDLPIA
jgi:hypothetical protein